MTKLLGKIDNQKNQSYNEQNKCSYAEHNIDDGFLDFVYDFICVTHII